MKLIWYIYDSKYGNNKFLAEKVKKRLEIKFEVKIGYAKTSKVQEVLKTHPFAIILGGPIRFGLPSFTMKRWIKKFAKYAFKANFYPEKAITYCTAFGDPEKGKIIQDLAIENKIAKVIDSHCAGLLVKDLKGPFKNGEIENFSNHVFNFLTIS